MTNRRYLRYNQKYCSILRGNGHLRMYTRSQQHKYFHIHSRYRIYITEWSAVAKVSFKTLEINLIWREFKKNV